MSEKFKIGHVVSITLSAEILEVNSDGYDATYKVETIRDSGCCMLPATFWCYPDELKKLENKNERTI
jgi:hypothetical protein